MAKLLKPKVPKNENLTIEYLKSEELLNKKNVAKPEKEAIKKLIKIKII